MRAYTNKQVADVPVESFVQLATSTAVFVWAVCVVETRKREAFVRRLKTIMREATVEAKKTL